MAESQQEPKVTLHWLNGSRAQGILWLLEELKVPCDLKIYHRKPTMEAPPELEKIHPLGKAPIVTVDSHVLAESGFIVQYFCDHFAQGTTIVPKRWKEGQEGKLGGETEEWMRYQYLLYYTEGSLMPYLVMDLIMSLLKGPQIPWLVRPISGAIGNQVISRLVFPNIKRHFTMLESLLAKAPSDGKYLCGPNLTAADILIAFPLLSARPAYDTMGKWEKGSAKATYPKLFAYIEGLENEPGFKKAADRIREIEGHFQIGP